MLKIEKKVMGHLNKCYSLALLEWNGKTFIACAAEKQDPAYLFDDEGCLIEQLWDGPGGVMSMEQISDIVPTLFATERFYSPNDGSKAAIVYYQRKNGIWERNLLCKLPFVHRFGILEQGGIRYLIACTIKSAHAFKDDWTCPGRVWVGELDENLSLYDSDHPLKLTPLISGLYHNHGFCKLKKDDVSAALIGADNGIYKVIPPKNKMCEWQYQKILDVQASDMVCVDLDGDGKEELIVISPFHGDSLSIYRQTEHGYEWVYRSSKRLPFLHAICTGKVNGNSCAFVGNREGNRELFIVSYDKEKETYHMELIDHGKGAANCLFFGENRLVAANRESGEIAMYKFMDGSGYKC